MVDERERVCVCVCVCVCVIPALFVFVSLTQVCKWATSYSPLAEIMLYSTRTLQ